MPLVEAESEELYGAKAVGLGDALRAGLPVPPGVALPGPEVASIAHGEVAATTALLEAVRHSRHPWPCGRPRSARTAPGPASPDSTSPS